MNTAALIAVADETNGRAFACKADAEKGVNLLGDLRKPGDLCRLMYAASGGKTWWDRELTVDGERRVYLHAYRSGGDWKVAA